MDAALDADPRRLAASDVANGAMFASALDWLLATLFIVHGTLTDQWEGLTWSRTDGRRPMSLKESQDYCGHLELGHKKNWRLPTLIELRDALYIGLEVDKPGLGFDRRARRHACCGDW